jgi:hypothetical protein
VQAGHVGRLATNRGLHQRGLGARTVAVGEEDTNPSAAARRVFERDGRVEVGGDREPGDERERRGSLLYERVEIPRRGARLRLGRERRSGVVDGQDRARRAA